MKLIKLSLAAAVATGAFTTLSAMPLEEAIQGVDVKGMLRYRMESDRLHVKNVKDANGNDTVVNGYNQNTDTKHKYKLKFAFRAALSDNLKVYTELHANGTDGSFEYMYKDPMTGDKTIYNYGKTDRATTPLIKYFEFTYNNPDIATSITAGRTKVASIWTDDVSASGIVITNTAVENITLAAYMFDNYSYDDMFFLADNQPLVTGNLYGAAMIANFEPVSLQLWAAYNNNLATLYAVDAAYNASFGDDAALGLQAQYIGNKLQGAVKNAHKATDGKFIGLKASGNIAGFDAQAGMFMYGDKDKFSASVVEDLGQTINAGQSLVYSTNSGFTGSLGENHYMFIGAGYTLDSFRVGLDAIMGTTKWNDASLAATNKEVKVDKKELVGSVSYAYSPKVELSGFISYYTEKDKADVPTIDNEGKFMRFQAAYYF